ncbi:ATP-dependent zinc metalloprotease FtsH [Serratia proteamaculans]|uniref:AAA family ATPase n=1 Tax=Serratia proteamaculans TaxID=28151 RepID=UPI0021792F13|nr:ATP-binding protein [Serratia proteamaculans]CAI1695547.1 ATP-dependent zinc metalloprotease FtsH [Serratia proteamaculans]
MASANQLKLLIKSHINKDDRKFLTTVLQIAAHEAKIGHANFADELRTLVEKAKLTSLDDEGDSFPRVLSSSTAITSHSSTDLFTVSHPTVSLKEIILSDLVKVKVLRFLDENKNSKKIRQFGLTPRRHLMLFGPPGTGKTMTASVIAHELSFPLFTVRMDSLITKFMGETSAKLRSIFDYISQHKGVYLFDEFDTIGSKRSMINDVGEIRRVLNTFLQLLDDHRSDSLIITATNHKEILDSALYRRFDDVIEYKLPVEESLTALIESKFISYELKVNNLAEIATAAKGLSYAEISKSCDDAIKFSIINNDKYVTQDILIDMFLERKSFH